MYTVSNVVFAHPSYLLFFDRQAMLIAQPFHTKRLLTLNQPVPLVRVVNLSLDGILSLSVSRTGTLA